MKKLFVLVAMMLPVFAFAGNNVKADSQSVENTASVEAISGYIIYHRVDVSADEITLPFVVKVPAPSEPVIGISGPVRPNITNWTVSDGYLTITYTQESEIIDLRSGGTFYIEVATSPIPTIDGNQGYAIELVVF